MSAGRGADAAAGGGSRAAPATTAAAAAAGPDPASFLSGESGHVAGLRLGLTRTLGDLALAALARVERTGARLDRLAAAQPPRRVLALSAYRPGSRLPAALRELRSSRHELLPAFAALGAADPALAAETLLEGVDGGKFQNLNRLLAAVAGGREAPDWLLVVDDDVRLPPRFLDRAVALCERFRLDLAQPALTLRSHAAWRVTRRRPRSLVRLTRFVEIGPVTLLGRRATAALTPFPELRYGWGLDLHWAALAERHGWRLGVLDALPVRHEDAAVASAYGHDAAIAEAARFLRGRPYLPSGHANDTLATLRRAG